MNVVPRSTGNTNSETRELTLKCKFKCYFKPMNNPLGVSPSKGKQGTTRGKEKIFLTSVGIEPTTYGLDLPSLCRLSYKVAQRKSGTIFSVREVKKIFSLPRVVPCFPLLGLTPSGLFMGLK